MLRKPQASDWAADDDDNDVEIAPIHMPQQQQQPSVADRSNSSSSASNARSGGSSNNSRQDKSASTESEPPRNRWGRTPEEVQAGGRRSATAGSDSRGDYNRSSSSGGYDRDARRDGGYGGNSTRDYDRRDSNDRFSSGGGYNSRSDDRYGGGRNDDRYGGGRNDDRYGGGRNDDRYGGGRNDDRYGGGNSREPRRQHVETPVEQGVVVAIKESFGFVSCMDRDGDLFFHITEAPVDVQVHDEVEFRVRYNQRSGKEVASQLVLLPKGTIVLEDVSDEVFDGVVTRGLRSSGPSHSDARQHQRDDSHGLIELAKTAAASSSKPTESAASASASDAADVPETDRPAASTRQQRNVVRFTLDSISALDSASDADAASTDASVAAQPPVRRKKPVVPAYGDEVQFRIATHRKTGARRAVALVVTASAKAKLELAIESKLATMTRECGIIDKLKTGGGFIRCRDRPDDVYFPLHEVRASDADGNDSSTVDAAAENVGSGDAAATSAVDSASSDKKASSSRKGQKKPTLREGDEVSFFVYEERDDESSRARPRLTALRVQQLPKGSVTFETLVRARVSGVVSKTPKEPRNGPEVIGAITPTADQSAALVDAASGAVSPATTESTTTTPTESTTELEPVAPVTKKSKDTKKKSKSSSGSVLTGVTAVPFRLSDAHDVGYIPGVGDAVVFDEVVETRNGKHKAVNVQLVALNAQHRERGVITSLRDDFGFIKCADRAMDAYFRFSDVLTISGASGRPRDVRLGVECAFDVSIDPSKGDNARAVRVELLPAGSVQWERTIAERVAGEVVAVPGSAMAGAGRGGSGTGGRGSGGKSSLKAAQGRVRLAAGSPKFWIEYLPELKAKIDNKFVDASASASDAVATDTSAAVDASSSTTATAATPPSKPKKELRLLFPASLSNAERFIVHQYCDALAITHQSTGDGASRRLELVAARKVPALSAAALDALPALELEFRAEDVAEVRYSPRVGDRVAFTLAQATRTKQLQCKSVVCVEAIDGSSNASAKSSKNKSDKVGTNASTRGEGFIVLVRSEGFGFIQPAVGSSGPDENLFFHIKEVTTGELLDALKPGMEVQYTATYDDVKKKTRAVQIAVVPPGTIQKPVVQLLRGVVTRPSLLQPLKGKSAARYGKSSKAQGVSTVGKIRAVTAVDGSVGSDNDAKDANNGGDNDDDAGRDDDEGEDDGDAADGDAADDADATTTDATTSDTAAKASTSQKKKKKKAKTAAASPSLFAYNLKDVVDASVVLREGDEVEFTAVASAKGPRASQIRVVALHAKQGVVVRVHDDFSGVIRVDTTADADGKANGDASALELPFAARHVLRGDLLSVGDRVEFAHSMTQPDAARKIGTAAAAAAKADAKADGKADATDATDAAAKAPLAESVDSAATESTAAVATAVPSEPFVGQALSVLRISAAPAGTSAEQLRVRAPRVVNSSLLQAMRQVGASAVVRSRMAKGPDGTRGFKDGWRAELLVDATSDAGEASTVAAE